MKTLSTIILFLSATLISLAQFDPPPADRSAVTVDSDGIVVSPENFWDISRDDILEALGDIGDQPVIEVADNDAKLALTDIIVGQRVRLLDTGRVEMYLGESDQLLGVTLPEGAFPQESPGNYFRSNQTILEFGTPITYWAQDPDIDPTTTEFSVILERADGSFSIGYQENGVDFFSYYFTASSGFASPLDTSPSDWEDENDAPIGTYIIDPYFVTTGPESETNWVQLAPGGRNLVWDYIDPEETRFAVFVFQVPTGSGFTDFELKASVTEFEGATPQDRLVFYYHSPDPEFNQQILEVLPLVSFTRSGPDVLKHYQQRADASIYDELPHLDSDVGSIVVIVRPGPNDDWLYRNNNNLLWSMVFFDPIGPETDTENRQVWRAVRPVEWIRIIDIPSFLEQ